MTNDCPPSVEVRIKQALPTAIAGPWRIRTLLRLLMLACLIPGIVGVGLLFWQEYQRSRAQLERDTIATARAMVQAVDNRLAIALTAAQGLAATGAPDRNEYQRYYLLAKSELEATGVGMNFVLSDRSGQQLINTLKTIDEPLPRHGNPAALEHMLATGKPVISDLYIGGVLKKPVLSIEVPLLKDGKIAYGLAIGLSPREFDSILAAQRLPKNWIAAIFDSSGTIVARTHAPDVFVGQKGTTEFIEYIKNAPEGVMKTVTREGIPTVSAWSRSTTTGWSVGIGIPRKQLDSELNSTMTWLAGGIFAVLGLSLALAGFVAQKIATSVRALTTPAKAMIAGQTADVPSSIIFEAVEIADEIQQATTLLRDRAAALEVANHALDRLAHIDVLTGLQNRLVMNDALHIEHLRHSRTQSPYAVLFIDIDFFKKINDTYGHEQGDYVLRDVAQLLQSALRETDLVARYGGEEFLALLPETGREEAMIVAEKIRRAVSEHGFRIPRQVTVSIGVAFVSSDDQTEEDVVRRADIALYEAKESGRDKVC